MGESSFSLHVSRQLRTRSHRLFNLSVLFMGAAHEFRNTVYWRVYTHVGFKPASSKLHIIVGSVPALFLNYFRFDFVLRLFRFCICRIFAPFNDSIERLKV